MIELSWFEFAILLGTIFIVIPVYIRHLGRFFGEGLFEGLNDAFDEKTDKLFKEYPTFNQSDKEEK